MSPAIDNFAFGASAAIERRGPGRNNKANKTAAGEHHRFYPTVSGGTSDREGGGKNKS